TNITSSEGRGMADERSIAGKSSGGDDLTCDPEDCERRHRSDTPGALSSFTSWVRHEDLSPSRRAVLPAPPVRRGRGLWLHVHPRVVRRHGGRAVRREMRRTAARVPGEVLARRGSGTARAGLDRQAHDTGAACPAEVGQLNCWTKVEGAGGSTLHHVWFHGDTQVGDVELQVGGSPWRTWSRKTVPADWTGAWHVEVR